MYSQSHLLALLPFLQLAYGATFNVDVGNGGLSFSPSTIHAAAGDKINFHYFPGGHSVAQSSFSSPCKPLDSTAIFSGFVSPTSGEDPKVFQVTVKDTSPMWFYCSNTFHCSAGMSMVVNPPASGDSLSAYQSAAKSVGESTSPSKVQGGVFVSAQHASGSSAPKPSSTSAPPTSSNPYGGGGSSGASVSAGVPLALLAAAAAAVVVLA